MSEVFGVWEHPPNADLPAHAALCLLDRGDAVRLYLRMTIQGQQLVSDTVLPLDGSRVGMGDSTVVARREHGALVLEREGGGTPAGRTRYERVEEGLLERHEGGTEHLYLPSSTKQVLVYRRELQMRKGKIAAQCAHGSMAVFFRRDPVRAGRLDIPL
ncbi:MAG: hypothetical protein KC656_16245, partial [Myxococcales bacterium]|nr:hypothetical protein [Myxococcales bacterium]